MKKTPPKVLPIIPDFVSPINPTAHIGEHVGLEEIDDGQWDVYFANYRLGRLHEKFMRIEDHLGKLKRRV